MVWVARLDYKGLSKVKEEVRSEEKKGEGRRKAEVNEERQEEGERWQKGGLIKIVASRE